MAAVTGHRVAEIASRVRADLEIVPADVREHRDRHRQRARAAVSAPREADREGLPEVLHRQTDGRSGNAEPGHGGACRMTTRLLLLVLVFCAGEARAADPFADAQALFYDGRYGEA